MWWVFFFPVDTVRLLLHQCGTFPAVGVTQYKTVIFFLVNFVLSVNSNLYVRVPFFSPYGFLLLDMPTHLFNSE